jgi:hypothetical protein
LSIRIGRRSTDERDTAGEGDDADGPDDADEAAVEMLTVAPYWVDGGLSVAARSVRVGGLATAGATA